MLFESEYRPAVIVAELVDNYRGIMSGEEREDSHARTRQSILDNGYSAIHVDEVNTVFVRAQN